MHREREKAKRNLSGRKTKACLLPLPTHTVEGEKTVRDHAKRKEKTLEKASGRRAASEARCHVIREGGRPEGGGRRTGRTQGRSRGAEGPSQRRDTQRRKRNEQSEEAEAGGEKERRAGEEETGKKAKRSKQKENRAGEEHEAARQGGPDGEETRAQPLWRVLAASNTCWAEP